MGRDLAAQLGLLERLQRLRGLRAARRRAVRAHALVPAILANLATVLGEEHETWRTHEMLRTLSDVTILTAGPVGLPYRALIKIADTPVAADGVVWQRTALGILHDDERLGDWRAFLPRVLDAGQTGGTAYLVEHRLKGGSLEHALTQPPIREIAVRAAVDAIGHLHRATATEATIGEEILDRWVGAPIAVLSEVAGHSRGARATLAGLARLSESLRATLEDQPIILSWVHGDYAPGNILTSPDGHISGIVDWEHAHAEDLPSLDVITLLLTTRMVVRRQELGRVVCDLVAASAWTDAEAQLVAAAHDAQPCAALGTETVVLLCWLRHVATTIARFGFADNGLWMWANIHSVLDALSHAPPRSPVSAESPWDGGSLGAKTTNTRSE